MLSKNIRLKQARIKSGFKSALAASNFLSIPYGTYSGHENGSRGIKENDILRYARAFKVSAFWLAFGQSRPKQKIRIIGFTGSVAQMIDVKSDVIGSLIEIEPSFPIEPESKALIVVGSDLAPIYENDDIVILGAPQKPSELVNIRSAAFIANSIIIGKVLEVIDDQKVHIQFSNGNVKLNANIEWICPIVGIILSR